jgi:fused signal recognition particle receptor
VSFFRRLKEAIIGRGAKPSGLSAAEIEDLLIEADFGYALSSKIAGNLSRKEDPLNGLRTQLDSILGHLVIDLELDTSKSPFVIVMVGVNGSGKTTTVAKIAKRLITDGHDVSIAACDTFRAAATEQLSSWADRLGCHIFKGEARRDPASVAYEAMQSSKDVLIIDTAGRLQNNTNLMNELSKLYRVINKLDTSAPHMNILVIDATTGQNAIEQAKEFGKVHPISGIVMAKMDGNAKGGTVVRIAHELRIPIVGIGTGETEHDLTTFSVEKFLDDLSP